MITILKGLWAIMFQGKRYVSDLKMIDASVWWDDGFYGERIASFEKITKHTAIGVINADRSAKVYFPTEIREEDTVYRAKIELHALLMPDQLDHWVNNMDKYPFL